jgi:DNA polymerase V
MERPLRVVEITSIDPDGASFSLPLFNSVQAGFPSTAEDYTEDRLDLNRLLIKHPAATFFVRVEGDSMKNAHIISGDILIVDRAIEPASGKIVVAVLNGEFTVKRLKIDNDQIILLPENPKFPPILITKETDFQVWGVVTYVLHSTG